MQNVALVFQLLGSLGVFLFGMKLMSEALQRVAGKRLKQWLARMTANPALGVLTGFLVTSVVQSSSATTVMVVSFVNAQLLTLMQAIGVVMGANIGTTVTGWLVALLGFKVKIAKFALPAIAVGFGLGFVRKEKAKQWGEVLLGFGLLFLGLSMLKDAVPDVEGESLAWVTRFADGGFLSAIVFVGIGTALTVVLQSSSATMALTLTMAAKGWIPYPLAAAMVLGENIGTTATANLAAIGTSAAARRTARVHLLFNCLGVTWALILLYPAFLPLIEAIVPGDLAAISGGGELDDASKAIVTAHLAAFHTVFNITNTAIMLPFTGRLAALVTRWVPDDAKTGRVSRHLTEALPDTAELSMGLVRQEMARMTSEVREMFGEVSRILPHPEESLPELVKTTLAREETVDRLEVEITDFLNRLAEASLSGSSAREISAAALNTHRIERIGDHCEALVRIAQRAHDAERRFDAQSQAELKEMLGLVDQALAHLSRFLDGSGSLDEARALEAQIDAHRDAFRDRHIERLKDGSVSVSTELDLLDLIGHLEEIGDRCIGVVARTVSARAAA